MEPLSIVLACLGASALAGGWDLGRRWMVRDELRPDPAEVEKYEVEKLHELEGRIQQVELGMGAVADQALHELESARAERRTAHATLAGQKGGRGNKRTDPEPEPERELSDDEILEQVRARYEPQQAH